jgi:hypothetical protein
MPSKGYRPNDSMRRITGSGSVTGKPSPIRFSAYREPSRGQKAGFCTDWRRYDRNARFRFEEHNESDESNELMLSFLCGFAEAGPEESAL